MRHIRTRRRYKAILILLFAACLALFFETRLQALVPELKRFAEMKVEDTLDGKIQLSIGSIEGGILQPFVFRDIAIRGKKDSVVFQSLVIDSIRTNYRIWDLVSRKKDGSVAANLLEKNSSTYIKFSMRNNGLAGFLGIEGDLLDSRVTGYLTGLGKEKVEFSGRIKGDIFDIEVRVKAGAFRAIGTIAESGDIKINLKVNHLKLGHYDIVCDADLKNRFTRAPDGAGGGTLEGEFATRSLILNYKPLPDMQAKYRVAHGTVEIENISLGESFKVYGTASVKKPNDIDLTLIANNVSLEWLMKSFGAEEALEVLSGTMNGKFEFKGPVKSLKMNSHFEIRKGKMATLDFDSLSANLRGDLPFVRIEDARITRESGYFALAGEMDMSKIGKASLFKDVKLTSDDNAITWDSWDVAKRPDTQEISMRKKLNEDFDVGFKKVIADDKIDASQRSSDEVRLDYKLQPNDSLKVTVGQESNFFGFEHKDKF